MIGKIKEYRANQLKDVLKDLIRYFQYLLEGNWHCRAFGFRKTNNTVIVATC
jgi:hypothetical protein